MELDSSCALWAAVGGRELTLTVHPSWVAPGSLAPAPPGWAAWTTPRLPHRDTPAQLGAGQIRRHLRV